MTRLIRSVPGIGLLLVLAGCPQMMVYDPDQKTVLMETIETAPTLAAAKPRFLAASVLGGTPSAITNPVQNFSTDQRVTLESATEGATVYYTTDGTAPNPYSGNSTFEFVPGSPITSASGDGTTVNLRAIALKSQMYPSEIVDQQVTITYAQAAMPSIVANPGASGTTITITSATSGATIWYTLTSGPLPANDPADPVPGAATLYSGPFLIDELLIEHNLRAIATKNQLADSPVAPTAQPGAPTTVQTSYAPAGLSVGSATSTSLTVSWNVVPGADGYEVRRDSVSGMPAPTLVYSGSATSIVDSDGGAGLSGDATYYYVVRATRTGYGSGPDSAQASATTLSGPPAVPTGLLADNPSQTTLYVSWNTVAGADSYQVQRSLDSGFITPLTVHDEPHPTTAFTDVGLSTYTKVWYRVRATNAAGSSAWSTGYSATTKLLYGTGVLVQTFPTATETATPMSVANDGTYLYSVSLINPPASFARYWLDGTADYTTMSANSLRSITIDAVGSLFIKEFGEVVNRVDINGAVLSSVTLAGVDPQSSAAFDPTFTEYYTLAYGVVSRYSAATGLYLGQFTLNGMSAAETTVPDTWQLETTSSGQILTYSDGVVSAWDTGGDRMDTVTIPIATALDNSSVWSFGVAGNRVYVFNTTTDNWEAYDIGL